MVATATTTRFVRSCEFDAQPLLRPAQMTHFYAAHRHRISRSCSDSHAASACDMKVELTRWTDCVEKLEKSTAIFFGENPLHRSSECRTASVTHKSSTHGQVGVLADLLDKFFNELSIKLLCSSFRRSKFFSTQSTLSIPSPRSVRMTANSRTNGPKDPMRRSFQKPWAYRNGSEKAGDLPQSSA